MSTASVVLRPAVAGDAGELLRLIHALAEYERLESEVSATAEDLRGALSGASPLVHALLAEAPNRVVGFALWFYNFSTFTGKPGLYLEDVFIAPEYRGTGIGRKIFRALARRALQEGCERFEWVVLDANTPAIQFYAGLGARPMSEWTVQRLSGSALARLAA